MDDKDFFLLQLDTRKLGSSPSVNPFLLTQFMFQCSYLLPFYTAVMPPTGPPADAHKQRKAATAFGRGC